jgi:hypothetical protein
MERMGLLGVLQYSTAWAFSLRPYHSKHFLVIAGRDAGPRRARTAPVHHPAGPSPALSQSRHLGIRSSVFSIALHAKVEAHLRDSRAPALLGTRHLGIRPAIDTRSDTESRSRPILRNRQPPQDKATSENPRTVPQGRCKIYRHSKLL